MRLRFLLLACLAVLFAAPLKAAPRPTADSDQALAIRSRLAILADTQVSGFDIKIQAKGGVVTASGTVDTALQRRVVHNILRSVRGVRDVQLDIQLNPEKATEPTVIRLPAPNRRKDEDIASRVRTALTDDKKLSRSRLDVQVTRRMVRLGGTAQDDEIILHAAELVRTVPGVLAVDVKSVRAPEPKSPPGSARLESRGLEMSQLSPSETRELQRALMLAGIYKGAPDGVWTDRTEKALVTYQARYNLPITGRLDSATIRALHLKINTEGRPAELGPRSLVNQVRVRVISDEPSVVVITASDVRAVQQALAGRGFYSGPTSGRVDLNTRAALRAFQRAGDLVVTGNIDQATINALGLTIDISRKDLMQ